VPFRVIGILRRSIGSDREDVSKGVTWSMCEGASPSERKEHGMKELRAVVSDEEFATLEHLAQDLGVSLEELVRRSLAAYKAQAQAAPAFEPIGFGMWADRPEMQDAAKWVAELRHREWTR
jgi:hypothetical protein